MMGSKKYTRQVLLSVLLFCMFAPCTSFGDMVVGVLFSGNIPYYRSMHVAFLNELKMMSVQENIKYVTQFPAPDPVAWSNSAKKLVIGRVDLILGYGYPAASAAVSKESDIPIVYVGIYDPKTALERPNVTGCSYKVPLSSLLRYYTQITAIRRLAVIYNSNEEDSARQMNEIAELAGQQKVTMVSLDLQSRGDIHKLELLGTGDAVFITGSSLVHIMLKDIMGVLWEKKIPAVDIYPDSSGDNLIVTLSQEPEKQGRCAAEIVAKIIAGEKIEGIKPVSKSETELVFNLIEAKNLGVNIPTQLISEATRVIE